MAKTREYMDYLDEKIEIAPANSQEEYQAAETIAEIMMDHGLDPTIQEFDTHPLGTLTVPILYAVMLVCLVATGLTTGVIHVVTLLLAIAAVGLVLFVHFGFNLFENFGPASRSQNVVGVHRATGDKVIKGARPIVIVAHYDTPRESLLRKGPLARYQGGIRRLAVPCSLVVAVALLFQILAFLPQAVRTFTWVVGLIATLPLVLLFVAAVVDRVSACTVGSNDNKASVAALLALVDKVRPGEDRVTGEGSGEKPVRHRATDVPPVPPAPRMVEIVEEVKGVRHGADTLAALGILPPSCEVIYEEPKVHIVEETPEGLDVPVTGEDSDSGAAVRSDMPQEKTEDAQAQENWRMLPEVEHGTVSNDYEDTSDSEEALDGTASEDDLDSLEEESEEEFDEFEDSSDDDNDEDAYDDEDASYDEFDDFDDYEEEVDYDEFEDDGEEAESTLNLASVGSWITDRIAGIREYFSSRKDDDITIDRGDDRTADLDDEEYDDYDDYDEDGWIDDYDTDDDEDEDTSGLEESNDADESEDIEDATNEEELEETEEADDDSVVSGEESAFVGLPEIDAEDDEAEPSENAEHILEGEDLEDTDEDEDDWYEDLTWDDEEDFEEESEQQETPTFGHPEDFEYDESEEYEEYYEDELEPESYDEDDWYEEAEDDADELVTAPKAPLGARIKGFFQRFGTGTQREPEEQLDDEFEDTDDSAEYDDYEAYTNDTGDEDYEQDEEYIEEEYIVEYEEEYLEYEDEDNEDLEEDFVEVVYEDDERLVEEPQEDDTFVVYEEYEEEQPEQANLTERLSDPESLHIDDDEDADILPRDTTGLDTISDSYDLYAGEVERVSTYEKPEPVNDPNWGVSSFQPPRPTINIARRAALFDLPDPLSATIDPLQDENEYEDAETTHEEYAAPAEVEEPTTEETQSADTKQSDSGQSSFWGDAKNSRSSANWKGGATVRADLRDDDSQDPLVIDANDLQDAILELGDDFLIAHDIWFVATGASHTDHAGIKAFLDENRRNIRGAFLINLESIGAGDLALYTREGLHAPRRADRRLVRMVRDVAEALHIPLDTAAMTWDETESASAMRARVRAVSLVGLDENDMPALSGTSDDVPDNVSPDQVSAVVRIVTELIRRS